MPDDGLIADRGLLECCFRADLGLSAALDDRGLDDSRGGGMGSTSTRSLSILSFDAQLRETTLRVASSS